MAEEAHINLLSPARVIAAAAMPELVSICTSPHTTISIEAAYMLAMESNAGR